MSEDNKSHKIVDEHVLEHSSPESVWLPPHPERPTPPCSAAHILVASSLLKLIAILGGVLGAMLLLGGIYLAFVKSVADTKFNLFGNEFSSTSIGVSMAFIGSVLVIMTFRRVLRSIDYLAALPEDKTR